MVKGVGSCWTICQHCCWVELEGVEEVVRVAESWKVVLVPLREVALWEEFGGETLHQRPSIGWREEVGKKSLVQAKERLGLSYSAHQALAKVAVEV